MAPSREREEGLLQNRRPGPAGGRAAALGAPDCLGPVSTWCPRCAPPLRPTHETPCMCTRVDHGHTRHPSRMAHRPPRPPTQCMSDRHLQKTGVTVSKSDHCCPCGPWVSVGQASPLLRPPGFLPHVKDLGRAPGRGASPASSACTQGQGNSLAQYAGSWPSPRARLRCHLLAE